MREREYTICLFYDVLVSAGCTGRLGSNMQNNMETEIKLLIAKKDVKALVASPLVAKRTKKGSHKTMKLVNIYFDTRDLLLQQAGIAYRVRQNGKKYEATIKLRKTAAAGLTERQEYNVPVKNGKPDLSVFNACGLQVDFDGLLGTAQIEKLFTVGVKREIRLLQVTKETLVEKAVDQGFISAGGKKETIDEVELELKEGSLADLLAYTSKIATEVPVFTESRSKYARGLALLDKLEPEGSRKLTDIDWENSYCEEYKKLFYQCGTAILEEQNVFADCGNLQAEADRIFLPCFERMQEVLYWLQPVMDSSAGMQANLQGALRLLYKLRDTKALLKRWKSLLKLADGRLGVDKVTRILENRIEEVGDEVQRQILAGIYSVIVFSLWAAMEGAGWKAEEYLQTGQLLQVRVKDILEKIENAMSREKQAETEKASAMVVGNPVPEKKGKKIRLQEPGYITVNRLGKEFHYLVKANEISKLTDLNKESRKKLEKLGEAMSELFAVSSLAQSIPAELLKSNTVLAARQGGYLLGDLAAEQLMARKAVNKTFTKWMKTMKK